MLAGLSLAEVFWLACAGLALDAAFGEPRRAHPLVAFGRIADWMESQLNRRQPAARSNAVCPACSLCSRR